MVRSRKLLKAWRVPDRMAILSALERFVCSADDKQGMFLMSAYSKDRLVVN